jgi:hypothetical protein
MLAQQRALSAAPNRRGAPFSRGVGSGLPLSIDSCFSLSLTVSVISMMSIATSDTTNTPKDSPEEGRDKRYCAATSGAAVSSRSSRYGARLVAYVAVMWWLSR